MRTFAKPEGVSWVPDDDRQRADQFRLTPGRCMQHVAGAAFSWLARVEIPRAGWQVAHVCTGGGLDCPAVMPIGKGLALRSLLHYFRLAAIETVGGPRQTSDLAHHAL